jgi:hypothetical protein
MRRALVWLARKAVPFARHTENKTGPAATSCSQGEPIRPLVRLVISIFVHVEVFTGPA